MGSFLNPDTTRVIAKRIILTGHPFKVHKKTATVRYMFFNSGDCLAPALIPLPRSNLDFRRRPVLQTDPAPHQTWTHRSYPRITWYSWIFQGPLRRPHQSDGYRVYVVVQARLSQVGSSMDWRSTWNPIHTLGSDGRVILSRRLSDSQSIVKL